MIMASGKRKSSPSCLWTLFIVVSHLVLSGYGEKCLKDTPEINPKKYIHFENESLNITLEVSSRITHQLITHIFKILLQETVGYPKVEIYYQEDYFDAAEVVDRLSGPRNETNKTAPRTMINLEVWLPPLPPDKDLTDLIKNSFVKESGTVAPPGRFGWFIPKHLSTPITQYYEKLGLPSQSNVHYSAFMNLNVARSFEITNPMLLLAIGEESRNPETGDYYCSDPEVCHGGWYSPKQCGGPLNPRDVTPHYVSCAVLLAPDYNVTKFVVQHIEELGLYVKVVWLGPKLKSMIDRINDNYTAQNSQNKSFLVLNWYPSDVILRENDFISVTFPPCSFIDSSLGCKYSMMTIVKFFWIKLEKFAPQVYDLLKSFSFNETDYQALLNMYSESQNQDPQVVACEYLRKNYKPRLQNNKQKIYIGGIFPITSSSYSGGGIMTGAVMAKDAINKNKSILNNYELDLLVMDGRCSADYVMRSFIDFIKYNYFDTMVGVLGPACSETVEPLAGVSRLYKSLVISYSAEGASFEDRQTYPYFFRTIGENQQYKYIYLKLLQELGWKRVAALTEDGQKYTEYISHMQDILKSKGISLISNTKFPRYRGLSSMKRYLEDLKERNAKIIIADVFDQVARAVMCEAYKLDMTAKQGYVWFLPTWLNKTWYNTTYFNEKSNETVNCTTSQMIEAITGYFSMAHAYFAGDEEVMQENKTVGEWRGQYENRTSRHKVEFSPYAGYAYDAVWTYALALDKLVKEYPESVTNLHETNTTKKLVELVEATDFNGVSGRIKFHGGPSRISTINVMQWYNNQSHIVGQYIPESSKDGVGNLTWVNKIHWFTPDRKKPDDGTLPPVPCALEGLSKLLNVSCDNAVIILNVVVFSILIIVVATGLYIIKNIMKKRYKNEVQRTMKSLGLDLIYPLNGDLDKWEIPRETVVINRKLGEGAFGTVYGGEANFADKGWQAVAVKTLKVGSSTNEKVDFLSEAEVMKRFDHKNIVKLLGVCTKQEPVYTIMEFMLYGDLKTYLLARRHLVNNNHTDEAEDVSPKRLTGMALDVARGLSYLAELKYVHRDVASRNCLVNAQRVVKLGDFGMTRPISENDYYKFHRKGMLPVRWMAPESLALGMFTPSSDVWSYGVLLYEIITFGSFPYQGLSNSEVLDHVKEGNTLNIPAGVKVQLEGLLKSCWQPESRQRPQASEIVEFLANNPRLISPCLDIPLSSVQMEDTGQLEMHLPQQFRKCSSSFSFKNLSVPNGISNSPPPPVRKLSIPESGSYLQLDNCCPREPLLGPPVRSNSLLGMTKYVTIQHFDSGCEHDESEDFKPNGNVVTKV